MPEIFISYRREDTSGYAGRIYDHLTAQFGNEHVFMDVAAIAPGSDFVDTIEKRVASCDVLIALIGKNWLTSTDEQGRIRLGRPEDFVSIEVAAALHRNVRVIPVLVGGAKMPREAELPEPLELLSRRNAFEIGDAHFARDVADLMAALREPAAGSADVIADIGGDWKGVVQKGNVKFAIYFTFEAVGDKLFGKAVYPTGEAGILDGRIGQGTLSFTTKHIPNFAEEEATISIAGKISGDEIEVFLQDKDGYARGVAHRVARSSPAGA